MITRHQYRGCLKQDADGERLTDALLEMREDVKKFIDGKRLLAVYLYRYKRMCFLYYEALEEGIGPNDFSGALMPLLEMWPEEEGKTPWAYMYHIFHHSIPGEPEGWEKERTGEKTKIGRIAFLYPEKLFPTPAGTRRLWMRGSTPAISTSALPCMKTYFFPITRSPEPM